MPKKVQIKNYGCSSNIADGETLAGCLKQAGYTLVATDAEADLIIYNSCAVKGPTENRIIDDIKHAPQEKKIIVAGCLPKISLERLNREAHFNGAIGPAFGGEIIDVVERVLTGEKITNLTPLATNPLLSLPHQRTNPIVSIIPINYGCLGSCAYCCVVQARGQLRSYRIKDIVERAKFDYSSGAREFWLTSQDTASYGRDIKTNLAELLLALRTLKGDFWIRVGMMTPNLVADIKEQLICAFEFERVYKFLHLPVQSGDDSILKSMRRSYTAEQFKNIVDVFRDTFPDVTLATDIIVGFPGETNKAFENTLQLLNDVEPDIINVSKFFARPKTFAWKMKERLVEKEEIKRRSAVASDLAKQISAKRNKRWIGWSGRVLFDEKGKIEGSLIGRNFAYKPIVVKTREEHLGKMENVEVIETFQTYLKGKIKVSDGEVGYIAL